MNSHGVVGGDGAVEETPFFLARIFSAEFLEGLSVLPKVQNTVLTGYEIAVGDGLKHNLMRIEWRSKSRCGRSLRFRHHQGKARLLDTNS